MALRVCLLLALGALLLAAPVPSPSATKRSRAVPPLTTKVPRFVTQLCASARRNSPIPLVCPPLVPVTGYRPFPGLSGVLLGNTNIPPVRPPADQIYLLAFNGGDSGPLYWHWIAGMGTAQAIRYWVLSDARNEVKGKPSKVRVLHVQRRRVEIWRFPDYPAGGEFGGHVAAITRSGPYLVIASIHGYTTANVNARIAVALARKADATR